MKAGKRRAPTNPVLDDEAKDLTTAIRAYGRYGHVTVRADRGFLYVDVDEEPVARLKPLSGNRYGLSFHHHTGRWESTPFKGDLVRIASVLTNEFGAYLDSYNFPPTKNGSPH
jgi:hypothetical protein